MRTGKSQKPPILVVAAFPPELKALASVLRARAQLRAPAVARAVVGVGLVEAAAGAARAISLLEPRAVVLIGTAGVYPGRDGAGPAIGTAALVRRAMLASLSAFTGAGYLPDLVPQEQDTDVRLRRAIAGRQKLPTLDVACPLAITSTTRAATSLARHTGAALENLETFAVARACQAAAVPFAAVLGITNTVGPHAHTEWRHNAVPAAAAACAVVRHWLESAR